MTRTLWIRDPETIEAMASPVRQNIIDRLEAMGPSSVRELAESLDMAADSLYYHVKTLLRVGVLVEVGTRKSARRDESVYDLRARRWHLEYDPTDPANVRAVQKVTAGMLRQAERDFEIGMASANPVVKGPARNLWSLRLESSLTRDEVRAINHHLGEILAILRKPDRAGKGELHAVSWVIAPIHKHRRRRDKQSKRRRANHRSSTGDEP